MCRILGYFGGQEVPLTVIKNAAQKQFNGGPDGQYFKVGNGWAINNNRLAIQGLDGGIQPFSLNGKYAVYNGEIYNHEILKETLKKKGYVFNDHCDGAVILPLYELYGDDFVRHLDGMFAIAIMDEKEDKILLATDPSAIKSLYYYHDNSSSTLFFASELNSLFELPVPQKIRTEAVHEYLIGRSIWHNQTFFENINTLGPANLLIKNRNKPAKILQYQSLVAEKYDSEASFEDATAQFSSIFDYEIENMLQADVPVCLVTSGGLDSSYVSALAAKYVKNLECFNVAYEGEWPFDERHFAKEVADFCGMKYNQVLIREQEFPEMLEKTIHHLGQPNSAPHSLSTYALFKAINQSGFKVALTGEGADEFFGGYERFKKATFDSNPQWASKYFDVMCATTCEARDFVYSNDYKGLISNQVLSVATEKIKGREKILGSRLKALLEFDQQERFPSYILRRVDHLSMANAVEVRVPFCQPKVKAFANALPDKHLLDLNSVKKIVYAVAKSKLPHSILHRPKQPFTLPIAAMLKKGHILFEILNDTLHSDSFKSRGLFNQNKIDKLIDRQVKNSHSNAADLLWSVMVLELWLKQKNLNFNV